MNITTILSVAAPIAAPAAPMILFGAGAHHVMIASGIDPTLALGGAIVGAAGVEGTGALMCIAALEAIRRKSLGMAVAAAGGAVAYGLLVFGGIATLPNAGIMACSVAIPLLAYAAVGMFQSFARQDAAAEAEIADTVVETDNQVKLLQAQAAQTKAEAAKISAEARLAKSTGQAGQAPAVSAPAPDLSTLSTGQMDKPKSTLAVKCRAYYATHPGATVRECAEACECGHSTAGNYKPKEDRP